MQIYDTNQIPPFLSPSPHPPFPFNSCYIGDSIPFEEKSKLNVEKDLGVYLNSYYDEPEPQPKALKFELPSHAFGKMPQSPPFSNLSAFLTFAARHKFPSPQVRAHAPFILSICPASKTIDRLRPPGLGLSCPCHLSCGPPRPPTLQQPLRRLPPPLS